MIDWINVRTRVPDDRRKVLVHGYSIAMGLNLPSRCAVSKFNPTKTGGCFDIERLSGIVGFKTTHWAEINHPKDYHVSQT